MKKIFLFLITISLLVLTGCVEDETYTPVDDVLDTITLASEVGDDFNLVILRDNVELSWSSNNSAITIDGTKAKVTQEYNDIDVKLTVVGTKSEYSSSKTYDVKVLKKVYVEDTNAPQILTIDEIFEVEDEKLVKLECVTAQHSYSMGTHFTDGENTIYVYGAKSLEVGKTYEVTGTKTSYGSGSHEVPQIKDAIITEVTGDANTLEAKESTVNYVSNTNQYSYYEVNATISIESDNVYLVDGVDRLEVSSYNETTTLGLLKQLNGVNVDIKVYLTGGYSCRTVLTYVTEKDLNITDLDRVNAAANNLNIVSATYSNVNLPTTTLFDSIITWSSNNVDVLNDLGEVNRQEDDVFVTLTATITINDVFVTKEFEVKVFSINAIQKTELFISEYYEGASYNKYIEIYNPNDYDVELDGYMLKLGINGASFSTTYSYTGTLGAYETFVVAHSSSSDDIKYLIELLGGRGDLHSVANFNGNDTIGLFNGEELIDVFGVYGENPGTSWNVGSGNTVDHVIIRNAGYGGNIVWDTSEWSATSVSLSTHLDSFGLHVYN